MKLLFVLLLFVGTYAGFAQINRPANTPVYILYGERTPAERSRGPLHSGVLNSKVLNELSPVYPQKAKDQNIQGRVEVELLVNGDGEVIFANPLSGPEELWAESVKTAVHVRLTPTRLAGKPVHVAGRIILDFKDGKVVVAKRPVL